MFIKEIRLKNFRGFSDNILSFIEEEAKKSAKPRKTTILLGENGLGKSSLLKAIGLVTSGRDALAEVVGEPSSWIQVGKRYCEVEAVLVTQSNEERAVSLRIDKQDGVSDVIDRAKESMQLLEDALDHTNRNYFVLAYGASRRLSFESKRRSGRSSYRHPRAQRIATLFDPDATLMSVESWAMDLDYQKDGNAIKVVKQVLSTFLKEVKFSRIDKKRGILLFKTPLGEVPMSQLSDGYQNIAAWVGDLLYQISRTFDDYKAPLKTRGVLLIDEIDLHLHPKWQRELLAFLKRKLPNFQIIATTHSPITAQQAGPDELFSLHRKSKRIEIEPFAGNPKSLLVHQLMSSDLFGIESDESVEIEKKKKKYEKLAALKRPTKAQKLQLVKLKESLAIEPDTLRSNMLMSQDHLSLLEKIHDELEAK